jgi:small membrane protein
VIIQVLLICGLLLCLLCAFMQSQKSRLLSKAILIVALTGIYLVLFPEHTNELAHFVGVGRGADMVLYCWLVISIIVSMNLQLQILQLRGLITELAREIALQDARRSADEGGSGAHLGETWP